MKFSLITVTYNSEDTIKETIESVLSQTHKNIEYIVLDGGSTDRTVEIVSIYGDYLSKFISEPDNGMYDAINKGINLSTGDIIGIINSDDIYYDNTIIQSVNDVFEFGNTDSIWGDVVVVSKKDIHKIVRYYSSKNICPYSFNHGVMPPHPAVFIKRKCYDRFGKFNIEYEIASDYDLLLRFYRINEISYKYMPKVMVKMKAGGKSNKNISSIIKLNAEIYKIHLENGVPISVYSLLRKLPRRFSELINRPQ